MSGTFQNQGAEIRVEYMGRHFLTHIPPHTHTEKCGGRIGAPDD